MCNKIEDEFDGIDLGDKRLNSRAVKVLNELSANSESSLPASCCNWSEVQAVYRFFDNDKLNASKLLAPHHDSSLKRIESHSLVLCVEDTTFLNYSSQKSIAGLGPHSALDEHGYFAHCMLALSPQNDCLGVLRQHCWARGKTFGKRNCRITKPIEEKESFRWLEGYRHVEHLACNYSDKHFVYVADREADIYEIYNARRQGDFLIRAQTNRNTTSGSKVRKELDATTALGSYQINVPAHMSRATNTITLSVKAAKLEIKAPYRTKKGQHKPEFKDIKLTAIAVEEMNAQGIDEPIQWLLLTSLEVTDLKQAIEVVNYYHSRWNIEVFFRILKSGCRVESLQLKSLKKQQNALAIYMIIDWRILLLQTMSRSTPQSNCECILSTSEWKATLLLSNQTTKTNAPTLKTLVTQLACLGGYLNRKNDLPPGPKAIWLGLAKIRTVAQLIENKHIICV